MTSYHEFNKVDKARYLVDKMREGVNVALITDAGTPRNLRSREKSWLSNAARQVLS